MNEVAAPLGGTLERPERMLSFRYTSALLFAPVGVIMQTTNLAFSGLPWFDLIPSLLGLGLLLSMRDELDQ